MLEGLFQYAFLQHAVISAVLASIVCGVMGAIISEKKLVMMSGGIAHTAFGGIGLGHFLKIEPIIGALAFAVCAALGIARIERSTSTDSDLLIGMFWSLGMAIGILFISLTPGYPPDMSSYLFGDILTVSRLDIQMMLVLDVLIVLAVWAYFPLLKAFLFDAEFARVLGLNTRLLENLLYVLIALTIVILIRVVGIILVIALLTIPPAIAKQFSYDLKTIMLLSVGFGIVFCLSGLWLSYELHLSSGAAIIMLAAAGYGLASCRRSWLRRRSAAAAKAA
ncbi:MAG: metal ABC transporter permease [Sporomusaceae bacterium]|nr:metal ABC transporter permease [Sporomusaceae bacterium]